MRSICALALSMILNFPYEVIDISEKVTCLQISHAIVLPSSMLWSDTAEFLIYSTTMRYDSMIDAQAL